MKKTLGLFWVSATSLAAPASVNAADSYTLDSMHSMPSFAFKHLDFSMFRGRFDRISGIVTLDQAGHSGEADVAIEAGSVSTGVPKLDEFLTGPKFFDVAKFPSITFKSRVFNFTGEKLASVTGDLTMHGVTKPVTLQVIFLACHQHPLLKVPACGADARATIKRSDFGLDIFIPNDSDEVTIDIGVEGLKKQ
jgi:polyisoprenoid-binding protein YceI